MTTVADFFLRYTGALALVVLGMGVLVAVWTLLTPAEFVEWAWRHLRTWWRS